MTLLEMSLSLLFMALFFMALMAATSGVTRLTRGYTCRVLSNNPNATEPVRGCVGQVDEVSVQNSGNLFLANESALRALRDDLLSTDRQLVNATFAISTASIVDTSALVRADLQKKCLWEKGIPQTNGSTVFTRNYLKLSRNIPSSRFDRLAILVTTIQSPLPPISQRNLLEHFWFIRGGRLIGEVVRVQANGEKVAEPIPGMEAIEDGMLSEDSADGKKAISRFESNLEGDVANDELIEAPNQAWGIINQLCLFQNAQLSSMYLLSADRGIDMPGNNPPFFGQERGMASKQSQSRLLFFLKKDT